MTGEIGIKVDISESAGPAGWFKLWLAKHIIEKMTLYVGIPEKNAGKDRKDEKINNVQLAYIHSKGSPMHGIPARPFIEPAIELEENKEKIAREFKKAFEAALKMDSGGAFEALNKAGLQAEKAVKTYIGSDALAPNKPSTIRRKGSDRPLIDTGALRTSVTYVIEGGD